MSIINDVMAAMATFAVQTISFLGYGGILVLMALESMITPLPSELVMPFAGFLAAQGQFNIWLVILFSGIGSVVGSSLSYWMGFYGGYPLVVRFGKYFLLHVTDLKKAEDYFHRHGEKTIFICRFIPVIRHVISIPAGVARMKFGKFILYTFVGATIWNAFLAYLGYVLASQWRLVREYTEPISIAVAVLLVVGCVWFVYHHVKNKRKEKELEVQMMNEKS
jgi:membrane protein DedA with SNARE-associated domain